MAQYKAKYSRYRLVPELYSLVNPKLKDVDVKQGDCSAFVRRSLAFESCPTLLYILNVFKSEENKSFRR